MTQRMQRCPKSTGWQCIMGQAPAITPMPRKRLTLTQPWAVMSPGYRGDIGSRISVRGPLLAVAVTVIVCVVLTL